MKCDSKERVRGSESKSEATVESEVTQKFGAIKENILATVKTKTTSDVLF